MGKVFTPDHMLLIQSGEDGRWTGGVRDGQLWKEKTLQVVQQQHA